MATSTTKKTKKSGDPRKRAAASAPRPAPSGPTSASEWVSKAGPPVSDIELPSGNVARVRVVGPEAFMQQGIMPDTLTPIVEKAIKSKKGLKPEQAIDLTRDPQKLGALIEMLDRTCVYAIVAPPVSMPPGCEICGELDVQSATQHDPEHEDYEHDFEESPRDPDVLYVDRVDLEDKMFIMNFAVGGSRDLERFRDEQRAGLAGLPAGEGR